jgi:hypothetical protein
LQFFKFTYYFNYDDTVFNNGLGQVSAGADKLYSSVTSDEHGLGTLSTGINTINSGTEKLLSQFSPSSNTQTPTLYNGMENLSTGTQKFSDGISAYSTAVDTTLFTIIKTEIKVNPNSSAKLLAAYKKMLSGLQASGESADNPQVKMLVNLINIYSAATDPSITTVTEFETRLNSSSSNIVYNSTALKNNSISLAQVASKLDAQFKDGGGFKKGIQ